MATPDMLMTAATAWLWLWWPSSSRGIQEAPHHIAHHGLPTTYVASKKNDATRAWIKEAGM